MRGLWFVVRLLPLQGRGAVGWFFVSYSLSLVQFSSVRCMAVGHCSVQLSAISYVAALVVGGAGRGGARVFKAVCGGGACSWLTRTELIG